MPLLCCGVLSAAPDQIASSFDMAVPMRDGVRLSANVFRPEAPGRYPTILMRTPYGKGNVVFANYASFVEHGYVFMVQDVRGRYASEGVFKPLEQEPADGDDTLNWIARQPWSDGKVGMMGGSYLGIVQWKVAALNNPHLKAIFPAVSGSDDYRDRFYSPGGAMKLGQRLLWMSENLREPRFHPDFNKFVLHLPCALDRRSGDGSDLEHVPGSRGAPSYDSFWKSISVREQLDKIRVPVFSVGGWFDNFVESDLDAYERLRKNSGVDRILIGPWPHNKAVKLEGVDFGPDSDVPLRGIQMEWFDQFLKGKDTPLLSRAPVRIFVMGVNRWLDAPEWPPPARQERFYLESRGQANTLAERCRADLHLHPSFYRKVRRLRPVCVRSARSRTHDGRRGLLQSEGLSLGAKGSARRGTAPRRARVYHGTAAEGRGSCRNRAGGAVRGDFGARHRLHRQTGGRLSERTHAQNLTDGILRLRYRKSLAKPELARPGEICKLTIDAGVTGNVFQKGHRIRMEISSSNFPRFDRNPNTGDAVADATELRKATQTVYHDARRPSYLVLPVLQD